MNLDFLNKTDVVLEDLQGFNSKNGSEQCRGTDCDCWYGGNCNCDCNCVCDCDDCNCICDCSY